MHEEYIHHKVDIEDINRTESAVGSYRDIVSLIKDGKFLRADHNEEPGATSSLSNKAKAIEIQNSERIVFVAMFACFVVMGPTGKVYTVETFPVEKCSCLIPDAACSHVLAVKTSKLLQQHT